MFTVSERPDHPASDSSQKSGCRPKAWLFQIPHINSVTKPSLTFLNCILPSLSHGPCAVSDSICFLGQCNITRFLSMSSQHLSYTNSHRLLPPSHPQTALIKSSSARHHAESNSSQCSSSLPHWLHLTQWTSSCLQIPSSLHL